MKMIKIVLAVAIGTGLVCFVALECVYTRHLVTVERTPSDHVTYTTSDGHIFTNAETCIRYSMDRQESNWRLRNIVRITARSQDAVREAQRLAWLFMDNHIYPDRIELVNVAGRQRLEIERRPARQ